MRVLFFSTYEIVKQSGGVESVTRFLYEYLNSNGYSVYLMYWQNHKGLKSELCQVGLPDKCNMNSLCNIDFIKSYLIKNEIDVVINQTADNSRTSAGCTIACNELKIPLVSVLHNTPDLFLRENKFFKIFFYTSFTRLLIYRMWYYFQSVFRGFKGGKFIFDNSSCVVLLSKKYFNDYCYINTNSNFDKIEVINNPAILQIPVLPSDKENVVVFVGRLEPQKSVDKLLDIWYIIESKYKDLGWKLYILGDGSCRRYLENLSKNMRLRNVRFVGMVDPNEYYKRAKIFCMTSIYEGFPMTLLECQSFGVVPLLYNSFSAAVDIIDDGINGYLISPYKKKEYAKKLHQLMNDPVQLQQMKNRCMEKIHSFDPEYIGGKWINLINDTLNCKGNKI